MWSYMYFMLRLSSIDPSDFNALELYVHRLVSLSTRINIASIGGFRWLGGVVVRTSVS